MSQDTLVADEPSLSRRGLLRGGVGLALDRPAA